MMVLAFALVFGSGLALGTALSVVSPEASLCLLLVAFGSWERAQAAKARWKKRWSRW